jgi:hypothetical protein
MMRASLRARLSPILAVLVVGQVVACASVDKSYARAAYAPEAEEAGYRNDGDSFGNESMPTSMRAGLMAFDDNAAPAMAPPPPPPPPPRATPLPGTTTTTATADEKVAEASKRLVIYTGSMALLVPQTEPAIEAFLAHVQGVGGYLQNRSAASITVRVPAATFFPTLDLVRKSGQVTDEQISAADVTKQVFDMELRLQTAEESRKRMLKLLESATRMEDILAIEAQLRRLTDEIEGMKGSLRTLGDQIAFSTLTVSFFANAPAPNPYPTRTQSRFPWINQVGIERVLSEF